SKGGPEFVAGKTPVIENRPYVKFTGELIGTKPLDKPLNMALDKPTLASESVEGHSAICAVDGRPETFYQAKFAENCFLQVTPERIVKPKSIRIVFAKEAAWNFVLECSIDQENWTRIADVSGSEKYTEKSFQMDGKYEGLYFRITFKSESGLPAPSVSEFEIIL
ncbi:MAG: discoidin domain-containing protein, partial [Lentisphaeria bacterium]|nr:discoidin domain-containing protein [Lentisphaeria bacterium]